MIKPVDSAQAKLMELYIHKSSNQKRIHGKETDRTNRKINCRFNIDMRLNMENRAMKKKIADSAFTLVEVLIVLMILAVGAMLAVPMMTSAAGTQIRSAANMIAADLEYAKSMSISRQQPYRVVFDENNETYQVEDANGVVEHPVNKNSYVINFAADERFNKVNIYDADFDPGNECTVTFDYLGSPCAGNGTTTALNSGSIELRAEGFTTIISVEPVTGYISISN